MICQTCGTEIADRALICYKCGTATTPAKLKPAAPARRGRPVLAVLTLVFLALAALYMGQAASDQVPAPVVWAVAALAAIIVAWRGFGRFSKK